MVPEKAMKKFAAKYAEDVQELLVLTAEGVRGAALWDKKLWQPSCRLLAYIDTADGTLHGGLNKPAIFYAAGGFGARANTPPAGFNSASLFAAGNPD